MSQDRTSLLDAALISRLQHLRIRTRRSFSGRGRGERRSTRQGASIEFRDFRKYEAGDDFRRVDWSIYARLDRLMLRQFVEEEDLAVDILVDQSSSMHFGEPLTKFQFSLRIAAALAAIAVNNLDRVSVGTFDSRIRTRTRLLRGRAQLHPLIRFLQDLAASASSTSSVQTDLTGVARSYPRLTRRRGVVFWISDFLDTGEFRREMKLLARTRFDINLIQVLARDEVEPELAGDLMLVDSESGAVREVTVNQRLLKTYRSSLLRYTAELESFSRANGIGYAFARTDRRLEELIGIDLIAGRMVG